MWCWSLLLVLSTAAAQEPAPSGCAVTSRSGVLRYEAAIVGEESTVLQGLLRSRAWLAEDQIRLRRGLFQPLIGEVEPEVVVIRRGFMRSRSDPLVGGRVTVRHGLLKSQYDVATGCSWRQAALGIAHIEALRADFVDETAASVVP